MSKRLITELGKTLITTETCIIYNNEILLFKRSEKEEKFPGVYMIPGGHVDEDEDFVCSAIREIEEETNIKVSKEQIKLKACAIHHHIDRGEVWLVFIYLARLDSKPKLISSSEGEPEWIEIDKAINTDKVFEPVKHYLDHVINDKPGILYTNMKLENKKFIKLPQ